jgi:type II secretory ATPase GspE/PulE/Tfp pilus assembly ATPase PilB-like protein
MVLHLGAAPTMRSLFTLESLGFHGESIEKVHAMLAQRSGVVLVWGTPQSGKSSLMYTLADIAADPRRSVISVEETIELVVPSVVQTHADPEAGVTLAGRLRSALLQDPDILFVHACTDPYVAVPAIHAANTGKLVVLSVQAQSLPEALQVLETLGVSARDLAAVLVGAIGTALADRLCPQHDARKLPRAFVEALEARGAQLPAVLEALKTEDAVSQNAQWKDLQFGAARPCEACADGHAGRTGIHEVTSATLSLCQAIAQADDSRIADAAAQARSLSLLDDGLFMSALGIVDIEEVFAATL